ncbi:hypothetical protein ACFO4E_01375 [Nocardiopsis mangrovi]|uniref:RHIM domain-containing protein n=1 Tax=Nocardiopsis mangrovi TaxID=1179818 RepID=A0ABV9DR08_9ACTN
MVDEVTIAIAAAVAGKAAEALTDGVRQVVRKLRGALRTRFSGSAPEALAALDAARDTDGEDAVLVEELAGHLAAAEHDDPGVRDLVAELRPHFTADRGGVVNSVHGDVHGTVIQTGTITGGVHLGRR